MINITYTAPLTRGPAVKRLQEWLSALGYDIGDSGPDGAYGHDTKNAVLAFQNDHDLSASGTTNDATWDCVEATFLAQAAKLPSAPDTSSLTPYTLIDIRDAIYPDLYRSERSPRPWDQITGITLHQTGCLMSERPESWTRVGAHVGITRCGNILQLLGFQDFVWHAQGLSHHTIGIEISGNMEGIEGVPSTLWAGGGGPNPITDDQIAALKLFIPYLIALVSSNGGAITQIFAHRQSSKSRQADPGSKVWSQVGLWAANAFGLDSGGPGYTLGDGLPIPSAWDPTSTYPY